MTQREIFLAGEADAWYRRNRPSLQHDDWTVRDPLVDMLRTLSAPQRVLEIGCSNGWRLARLQKLWPSAMFWGIDPAEGAIFDGRREFEGLTLAVGTANHLPFDNNHFDLVLFGFCLYLVDRSDLFVVAAEADRVLKDKGRLGILDFTSAIPYANAYCHAPGVRTFKMDYSLLWRWNPAFTVERQSVARHGGGVLDHPDDAEGTIILRKDLGQAWPNNPFPR